jgi:hypothetical protein
MEWRSVYQLPCGRVESGNYISIPYTVAWFIKIKLE